MLSVFSVCLSDKTSRTSFLSESQETKPKLMPPVEVDGSNFAVDSA